MAFALGSFVDGLFSGAKSTMDLIDTKRKMDDAQILRASAEANQKQADADVEAVSAAKTFTAALGNYGGGGDTGTTGPSTPPVPTEIKEGITGVRDPNGIPRENKGAPELVDRIAPLVSKRESGDRPYVGYGGVDLSKAPAKEGFFGFPDWAGAKAPDGSTTHAAGLFQFQPDTWKQYAGPLGITDFSPESQRKVFNAAYLAEGIRPWSSNRALIGDLAGARLLGGAATSAARVGVGQPSALNAPGQAPVQSPGSVAPDLEGQRAKAAPNAATTILKTIVGGGTTPAQQAPEGYVTMPPQLPMAPALSPPPTRSLAPSTSAADPVATAAATSALSPTPPPSASPSSPAPVTVTPPAQRPVLSQLRQMQSDQAAGIRPVFPPEQKFNSRGEAVSQDIGQVLPGQRGMSPSGAGIRNFAAANKIIRLPDGTMVDGIGNVVRQAPSALYPR